MELRHLRYFVAVAEELNFTRAAARLHTSQPSLSQQIRQLEAAVGVALLERSRHHVALTSAGRIFLREAKDILGRIEHAGRLARQASDGRAGNLSIGTFPAADVRILPALRPLIARRLPHLRMVLHSKYAVEPMTGLLRGTLDAAFMRGPIESGELECSAPPTVSIVLAWKSGNTSPLVRMFVDLVRQCCDSKDVRRLTSRPRKS
jgi:LysR family hca operon transcriptional activator